MAETRLFVRLFHETIDGPLMDLSLPATRVWLLLCRLSNSDGECYVSARTLAKRTHFARAAIFKALRELEAAELIKRRPGGGREVNHFRVTDETAPVHGGRRVPSALVDPEVDDFKED